MFKKLMPQWLKSLLSMESITQRGWRKIEKIKKGHQASTYNGFGKTSIFLFVLATVWSLAIPLLMVNVTWPLIQLAFSGFYLVLGNLIIFAFGIALLFFPFWINGLSKRYANMQVEICGNAINKVMRLLTIVGYLLNVAMIFAGVAYAISFFG